MVQEPLVQRSLQPRFSSSVVARLVAVRNVPPMAAGLGTFGRRGKGDSEQRRNGSDQPITASAPDARAAAPAARDWIIRICDAYDSDADSS